jgi:hypothetical protein
MSDFNPQVSQIVRYADADAARSHVQYVVLARLGSQVRIRLLGRPDAVSKYVLISELQPESQVSP